MMITPELKNDSLVAYSKETLVESRWTASPLSVDGAKKECISDALGFEKSVSSEHRKNMVLFSLRGASRVIIAGSLT
jgi:hypothetical protein